MIPFRLESSRRRLDPGRSVLPSCLLAQSFAVGPASRSTLAPVACVALSTRCDPDPNPSPNPDLVQLCLRDDP